jgi:hypothetical protein
MIKYVVLKRSMVDGQKSPFYGNEVIGIYNSLDLAFENAPAGSEIVRKRDLGNGKYESIICESIEVRHGQQKEAGHVL